MDAEQTIDRIHTRASDLIASLSARDDDATLRDAKNLRCTLDALIQQLTLAQFSTVAKARADLARILTAKGKLPMPHEALARAMEE